MRLADHSYRACVAYATVDTQPTSTNVETWGKWGRLSIGKNLGCMWHATGAHLRTPSLMWWLCGSGPPSFSHSRVISGPPLAEHVNSTALPRAFTSTCGETRTDNGATQAHRTGIKSHSLPFTHITSSYRPSWFHLDLSVRQKKKIKNHTSETLFGRQRLPIQTTHIVRTL